MAIVWCVLSCANSPWRPKVTRPSIPLTQRSTGPHSKLRVIDGSGAVTFATDLDADVRVLADPTASRVAYVAAGVLHELDPRTGERARVVRQTRSARYGPAGELVVLRADLSVEWLG